jgi:hypothetical protein
MALEYYAQECSLDLHRLTGIRIPEKALIYKDGLSYPEYPQP